MDPSLLMSAANTAGDLASVIYDVVTMPKRKREYMREARRQELQQYLTEKMSGGGVLGPGIMEGGSIYPTQHYESMGRMQDAQRTADKNFKVDPMRLIPFMKSSTGLASQIHGAAQGGPQQQRLAPDPIARAQQAAEASQAALERAVHAGIRTGRRGVRDGQAQRLEVLMGSDAPEDAEAEALKCVALDQIDRGMTYLLQHPEVPLRMKAEVERAAALARSAVIDQDPVAGELALQMLAELQAESKRLGLVLDVDAGTEA